MSIRRRIPLSLDLPPDDEFLFAFGIDSSLWWLLNVIRHNTPQLDLFLISISIHPLLLVFQYLFEFLLGEELL